jgi:inner membrane protein
MENLTHTLFGAVLSKAGLEKKTALATPTLIIAVNLPDIDIVGPFFGQNYLDFHRGFTHGVAGLFVLSIVLSLAVWFVAPRVSGLADSSSSLRFFPLWYISFLGLCSHTFLDFLNSYGVRPWLPFSDRRYYGDLVSVVDPWIWVLLLGALFLHATSLAGRVAWSGLAMLLAAIVFVATSPQFALVWIGVLVLAVLVGNHLVKQRMLPALFAKQGVLPAHAALMLFAAYLVALLLMRESIRQSAEFIDVSPLQAQAIDVLPGRLNWTVILETGGAFYVRDLSPWEATPPASSFRVFRKNWDEPCYRRAREQPEMAAMIRFARFPSVDVQRSLEGCTVFLRDLRYAQESRPGWGVAIAKVASD